MTRVPPSERTKERLAAAKAAYQAPSPALAQALREDLVGRFEREAPGAVRCFEEDFEACIAHLERPPAHRRVARTTNRLERHFESERRRTKVAPTLCGERPVLKLGFVRAGVPAADDRVSEHPNAARRERLKTGQFG